MKKALLALFCLLAIGGTVAAVTMYQAVIQNNATVVEPVESALHIFLNGENVTDNPTIDWGTLNVSQTYYYENLTVLNTGTICKVVMHINGTCPGTITWKPGNNTNLAKGESVWAPLELTVGTATGTFNWQLLIDAEEVT